MVCVGVGYPPANDGADEVDEPGQLPLSEGQLLWGGGGALQEGLVGAGRAVEQRDQQLARLAVLTSAEPRGDAVRQGRGTGRGS